MNTGEFAKISRYRRITDDRSLYHVMFTGREIWVRHYKSDDGWTRINGEKLSNEFRKIW